MSIHTELGCILSTDGPFEDRVSNALEAAGIAVAAIMAEAFPEVSDALESSDFHAHIGCVVEEWVACNVEADRGNV